jgi:hypothetical protein
MNKIDWRNIEAGLEIPTASYCDQPFVIKTDDGFWLCCVTTGAGHEGASGQHVTTMRSRDFGKTWSKPVPVETPGDVENSYAVMLKTPSGRIYIFYGGEPGCGEPGAVNPGRTCVNPHIFSSDHKIIAFFDLGGHFSNTKSII